MAMAIKIFGIYVKGEKTPTMFIQVKTQHTAEKCIDEYKAIGRLDASKKYEVKRYIA